MTQPVVKWVGGKAKLIPQLEPFFPSSGDLYVEPFLGGASVLLHMVDRFERAIAGDLNPHLINLYWEIQTRPADVITQARSFAINEEAYYKIRDWNPVDPIERAARFLYLNKTCFNGLYRENSKGIYNASWGKVAPTKSILDEDNVHSFSQKIAKVGLHCLGFEELLDLASTMWTSDSFVYADPPYIPVSPTANFTSYTGEGFGASQHSRLNDWMTQTNSEHIAMVVSNSSTELTRSIYSGWETHTIQARRNINRDGAKRGPVPELVIVNTKLGSLAAVA